MVAIVSGDSLGLSLSSLATLGQQGIAGPAATGRNGQQAFVNAATGNLTLQTLDDRFEARGADLSALRTYNSQGLLIQDAWTVGAMRQRLLIPANVLQTGSVMTRVDRDAAAASYSWNGTGYTTTAGAGADDTIRWDSAAGLYTYTEGSSGLTECYDSSGKLVKSIDAEGNQTLYTYDAQNRISTVTAANQEILSYSYNAAGDLDKVTTGLVGGSTSTVVRYEYDTSRRLTKVTVDLSRADNAIADGKVYVTNYTYDGTSSRVASVTQSDGTSLAFTYLNDNGVYKVASVRDALNQTTTYSYDTVNRKTTVTDPAQRASVLHYDTSSRLTQIDVGGALERRFTYNSRGDVLTVTDGANQVTTFGYDPSGNQTFVRDAAGNCIDRTFTGQNVVATETVYSIADPDGAGAALPGAGATTTYLYDTSSPQKARLVRFALSPEGRVTEHRYNAYGERTSTLVYTATVYTSATKTLPALTSWAATAVNIAGLSRTDMAYNAHGQLSTVTTYASVTDTSAGLATGASVTTYVYGGQGELLSVSGPEGGSAKKIYTYDGLGRLLTATDELNQTTITNYDDPARKTTVTLANGLATTQIWDAGSRLITTVQAAPGQANLGTTSYQYDGSNLLLMTTSPAGARSFNIYDDQNRLIGMVDGESTLTEYFYDNADRVIRTLQYATKVTATGMGFLVSGTGQALPKPLIANVRPGVPNAADRSSWNVYDAASRLIKKIDAEGAVCEYFYDGVSRLTTTRHYANKLAATILAALANGTATAAAALPAIDTVNDRLARNFYDTDNKLIGTLDAEGWLQELKYDASGRLAQKISYGTATVSADRAGGSFATLKSTAGLTVGHQLITTCLYDQKGLLAGQIDPENYLTEFVYDRAGRVTSSIRYVNKVTASYTSASTVATMRPTRDSANDRTVVTEYDLLGRVKKITAADGTVTTNTYDSVGNLVATLVAVGTLDERTALAKRYDVQGRVTGELTSDGYSLLTVGMTQIQIDAVWATNSITHAYDAAGRRSSTTNANGAVTSYTYDNEGRLKTEVIDSAAGGLQLTTQYAYDALGNLQSVTSPGGTLTTYGYDKLGRRTSETVDSGGLNLQRSWTYNANGNVVTATDGRATPTYSYYDRNGLLVSSVQVTGSKVIAGVTQPTARVEQYAYDAYGRLIKTTRHRVEIDSISASTTLAQVQAKVTAAGNSSTTDLVDHRVYDKDGRLTATVNALGEVTKYWYDTDGNVIDRRAYANRVSAYTPGTDPNPTDSASDQRLRSIYDKLGRVTYTIDGVGGVVTYTYDKLGNLTDRLAYATAVTPTNYVAGTPLLPTKNEGADVKVRNSYDRNNRLQWSMDGTGAVTRYYYDKDGRVVQKVADLDLVAASAQPPAVNPASGRYRVTSFIYDKAGRLTYTVDPAGGVSRSIYGSNGTVIQQIQYATAITAPAPGTILTTLTPPTSAGARVTNFVYDKADRLVYTVDSTGAVSRSIYDANGQAVQQVKYATRIAAPSVGVTATSVMPPASNAADQITNFIYDNAGRLVYAIDGTGAVTRSIYDGIGNVIQQVQYSTRKTPPVAGTTVALVIPTSSASKDRVTNYVYDAAGRVSFAVDSVGAVSRSYYDGLGNLIQQVAYQASISPPLAGTTVASVTPVATPTADRTTNFTYDGAGRLIVTVDAAGAVTKNVYDVQGNMVRQIRFGTPVAAPVAGTMPTGALPAQSLSTDRVSRMAYDQAQRLVYSIDASGAVSENEYDAFGNATRQILRDVRLTGAQMLAFDSTPTAALVRTQVTPSAGADRITALTYDASDRTLTKTDALGGTQRFTYDALGNKLTFSNELNKVWSYQYDRAGHLVKETSPPVTVTTIAAEGAAPTITGNVALVTDLVYDGVGNLTSRTESSSPALTGQSRTTSYEYDALGRQTKTIFPVVGVYIPETDADLAGNGWNGQAARQETNPPTSPTPTPLFSSTSYDALGNAVSSTDVGGKTSYKFYDKVGRVVYEVDALGYVTGYFRDAFGDVAGLTRYPTAATGVTAQSTININGLGEGRMLCTTYDKLGRAVTVEQPSELVFDPNGTGTSRNYTAGAETQNTYNAFGELIQVSRLKNNLLTWVNEFRYYNQLGQLTTTVDAGGYETWMAYDVVGNLLSRIEFELPTSGSTVTTAAAPAVTPGLRKVTFAYDALNRKTSETRVGVSSTDQETFVTSTSDISTSYAYDAVGNLVSTTTVDGTTYSYYDALGRVTAIAGAVQGGGSAVRPLTTYERDVFGNVAVETRYAKGAPATGYIPGAVVKDVDDRIARTAYDAAGHAIYTESKTGGTAAIPVYGAVQRFSYDAYGHVAKQWQTVTVDGASKTIFQVNRYDALGRLSAVITPASSASLSPTTGDVVIATQQPYTVVSTSFTYNAFGEQLTKSVNGVTVETNQYDKAGRLWRSDAGDGVDKVYLYDLLGNRTAEIRSYGATVLASTLGVVAMDTAVRRVDTYYDNLGRVIKQDLAPREEKYSNVTVRSGRVTSSFTSARATWDTGDQSGWEWEENASFVTLGWDSLAGLGAGEVKVVLEYQAAKVSMGEIFGQTEYSAGELRSKSVVLSSEAGDRGTILSVTDGAWHSDMGGVYAVNSVRMYKKDVNGVWAEVITPGLNGNVIEVDRWADDVSQEFQLYDIQDPARGWYSILPTNTAWRDFGSRVALDLRPYDPARYKWQLVSRMPDGQQQIISGSLASLTATANGAGWIRPVVTQAVDRWGNVLSITDPRKAAWITNYKYNANNQLIEVKQPIDTGGSVTQQVSSTVYYDKMGRQVGISDANNNLNRIRYDNHGNQIGEIHADGGVTENWFNTFGEQTYAEDAMGNRDTFVYDHLGRQTAVNHIGKVDGMGTFTIYWTTRDAANNIGLGSAGVSYIGEQTAWDTAGRKLSTTNFAQEAVLYEYDLRGNIIKTTRPDGTVVTAAYDAQDRKIAETDGLGNTMTWTYNAKGQLIEHKNLGAQQYLYTYNSAGNLTLRTGPNGHRMEYIYDRVGQLLVATEYENPTTLVQQTRYTYDLSGRKTGEKVVNRGVVYQDNHMAYDSLGRLRWVGDDHAQVVMEYDAQGNRTRVFTHVLNTVGLTDSAHDTDRYFKYDTMNRQKVVDAVDSAGNIGQQGHNITYDKNGNRLTDQFYGKKVVTTSNVFSYNYGDADTGTFYNGPNTYTPQDGLVTENYRYDSADRLISIDRDGVQLDRRLYDRAGRVVQTGGVDALPDDYLRALYGVDANGAIVVGNGVQRRTNHYDKGRLVLQEVRRSDGGNIESRVLNDTYDAAGNLSSYRVIASSDNRYTTTFELLDGYKERSVSGVSTVQQPGSSTSSYDGNGFLVGVTDATKSEFNRSFINDLNGQVIAVKQGSRLLRQLTVNGEVLGQYGSGMDLQTPRQQNGSARFDDNIAEFQFGYRAITPSYPSAGPGMYTIQRGDSLKSIAQTAYGDSRRWYQIAEANGIGSDSDLRVGQTLNLPNLVGGAHNADGDFQPYDPSKVVGDTTPFMAMPKKKSSFWKQLLMVIIVVVATIFTAGALSGALAQGFGATMSAGASALTAGAVGTAVAVPSAFATAVGSAGVAAAAGAVGSLAGQVFGVATGMQDKISWRGVALSAVSAGVGASLPAGFAAELGTTGQAMARAALGSTLTQGIGVATGLQKSFDWRGVAASAAAAGIGQGINDSIMGAEQIGPTQTGQRLPRIGGLVQDWGGGFGAQLAGASLKGLLTSTTAAVMRGGKIATQQVAVDAFGNALGSSIADSMNGAGRPNEIGLNREQEERLQSGQTMTDYGDDYADRLGMQAQSVGALRSSRLKLSPGLKIDDLRFLSNEELAKQVSDIEHSEAMLTNEEYSANEARRLQARMQLASDPITFGSSILAGQGLRAPQGGFFGAFANGSDGGSVLDRTDNPLGLSEKAGLGLRGLVQMPVLATVGFAREIGNEYKDMYNMLTRSGASYTPSSALAGSLQTNGIGGTMLNVAHGLGSAPTQSIFDLLDGNYEAAGANLPGTVAFGAGTLRATGLRFGASQPGLTIPVAEPSTFINTKQALQELTDRAVADLQGRPELARDLMSAGSYRHLAEGTNLAGASYGKAVERLVARYMKEDATLSEVLRYQSRPFVSTPDFFGHEGYNLRLLDITTKKSIPSHLLRPYGPATEYVFHPGLPKDLRFPQ